MDNTDLALQLGGISVFVLAGISVVVWLSECSCKRCKEKKEVLINGDDSLSEV